MGEAAATYEERARTSEQGQRVVARGAVAGGIIDGGKVRAANGYAGMTRHRCGARLGSGMLTYPNDPPSKEHDRFRWACADADKVAYLEGWRDARVERWKAVSPALR